MHVTKTAENALRAMLELTAVYGEWLKAEQLSRALDVPRGSIENILLELRRAGLVVAQRGNGGGYCLARPPQMISLSEVIRVVDGPLVTIRGLPPEVVRYVGTAANLQVTWMAVQQTLRAVLDTVSLADVVRGALPFSVMTLVPTADTTSPS